MSKQKQDLESDQPSSGEGATRPQSARPSSRVAKALAMVHDWNAVSTDARPVATPQLLDETLRDGLQSTWVQDPSIGQKLELLHRMVALGIDSAAIGIPCAHKRQYDDALSLAREIAQQRLPIRAMCAARTRREDIALVAEISQRAGIAVEAGTFVGSSPIRQKVEGWTVDHLERLTADAVSFAVKEGIPVLYVTEDTTRSAPDVLTRLYGTAIRCGAERICVADTVGHATPAGAAGVVSFVASLIRDMGAPVKIDWHGHRDRGLDLANCFAAWQAGAERCHGTALGVGERSGNTPIELLLVNLHLKGWDQRDLSSLESYVRAASTALGVAVPAQHPVFGENAFRTATGVHASAMRKAENHDESVLELLYSAVPPSLVGRRHAIELGPMSGESNARHALAEYGIRADDDLVRALVTVVKERNRVMARDEVVEFARAWRSAHAARGAAHAGLPSHVRVSDAHDR